MFVYTFLLWFFLFSYFYILQLNFYPSSDLFHKFFCCCSYDWKNILCLPFDQINVIEKRARFIVYFNGSFKSKTNTFEIGNAVDCWCNKRRIKSLNSDIESILLTSPVSQLKRTKHANQCSRKIHWFRLNFISWCSNKFVRCVCSFLRSSPHWISPKSYTFASYHTFWFWNLNLNLIFIAIIFHIYFASFSGHLDLPSVRSFSFSFFLYFVIIIFLFWIFKFAPSKLVLRVSDSILTTQKENVVLLFSITVVTRKNTINLPHQFCIFDIRSSRFKSFCFLMFFCCLNNNLLNFGIVFWNN